MSNLTMAHLLEAQRKIQHMMVEPQIEVLVSPYVPKKEVSYYAIFPVHPLVMWLRRWMPWITPWVWVYAPRFEEQAFMFQGRIVCSPAMAEHLKRKTRPLTDAEGRV